STKRRVRARDLRRIVPALPSNRRCAMIHARLVRPSTLAVAGLVAVALFAGRSAGAAASLTSRILIDPAGEHTGDVCGCSVGWVGDVNGDGYDDVLVGAFRYPEIQSIGQAYLYFGGPSMDAVPDLVIQPPPGGAGWFGVSVASAGDFNGDGYPDFIVGAQQAGNEGKAFIYYGGPPPRAPPRVTLNRGDDAAATPEPSRPR